MSTDLKHCGLGLALVYGFQMLVTAIVCLLGPPNTLTQL